MRPRILQPPPAGFLPTELADVDARLRILERTGPRLWFPPLRWYQPAWAATGTNPTIGATTEIVGFYSECNFWRIVRGHILFGGATPGTGDWLISFPWGMPAVGRDEATEAPVTTQAAGMAAVIDGGTVIPAVVHTDRDMTIDIVVDGHPATVPAFTVVPHWGTPGPNQPVSSSSPYTWTSGMILQWQAMVHVGPHPRRL